MRQVRSRSTPGKRVRVLPRGAVMERMIPHLFKGIPKCPECGEGSVRLGGLWFCKEHSSLDIGRKAERVVRVQVGELFPNRAARRAA